PCGPLLVEAALASEPPGGLALELAAECRLLRGRRVARFPVARPAMADMPDLSHLTDEEREIIEGVIMRQRQEEQREHEIMRRKQDEVAVLEQTIRTRNEMQRAAGVELAATCQICLKTKFADGVGHSCHYCRVRCCARCGGKVTLRSNKVIWVCILCRKKQELLSKTGQWIHKSTGHDSMLWRMESDLRNLLPQVDATLDKRPKLERAHSAAEKENLPLQRSGSALRRQYSQQDPKCYGDLDALPRAHQIPSYSRQKTAYGIDDLPPPSQSNQLLPLPHSSAIHPPLPPRSSSSDDEVQDCVSDENDEYRDRVGEDRHEGARLPTHAYAPRFQSRSATATPTTSPKKRQLPQIPHQNAQRAMRAQVSADLEERKWIGPHHIGATLTYRSTPQGWERHYAGLSDSELASRGGGWAPRRRLSPDAAAGDSDIESVGSVTSSAFSTQSERPRPTRMLSQPRNPFIIKSPSFDSIISLPHSNTNNIFQVNPNQLYNKPLVENKQNYTTLRENHHPHSMSKKIPFTSSRPSLPRSYIVVDPVSVFHDYGRSLSWPEYDELNYDNSISADTDQLLYNSKSSVKSNLQKYFTTKMQRFDSKYSKYTELYPNSKRFAGNDPDNLHPNPIHAPKTLLLKKLRGAFNFQFLDPDIDVILSRDDLNDQDNLDVTHFHGYGSDSSIAETTIHVNTDTLKNTPLNFSSLVESDYGYLKVDPVSLRRKQRESQDAIPFEMRDSKNQIDPFLKGDEVNVLKRRPFNNIYSLPTNKTVNKGRRGGYQNHRNMVSIEEVPTAKEYYSPYSPMSNLSFNDDIIFNNQCNVEECSSILTPPNHVEKQFKTEANVTVSSQKHGSPHRAPNPAASVPSENNPASEQSLNSSPSTKDANDKHSDDIANGANIKRKKSIENGPNCSNDYGGRENGRNNNQQPTLERRESRRGQFTRSLSNADAPDEKADGSLSDTALGATSENEPSGDDALLKAEPRDYFGPGMGKKSNSTSQLSATGRKRRLGFGKRGKNSFTVQRSEEVVPGEMRGGTGVSRASSASSENEDDRWSPGMRGSSSSDGGGLSDFIDGLGPGQLVGRQLLGAPTLGDVQLSMCYQKGFLEVEVIRGRGLQARQGSRTLPAPYVKVTVWGDYGRIEGKKVFMGVAQIMLDDLNLSNIVIGWYKLFGTTSLLYIRLKYRLNNSTETMNHYVYLNLIIKYILSPNQSRYIPRYLTLNVTMLCYLHRIKLKTEN
ncbi:unnamed protein product, partial [Leptidea sinapis]